MGKPFRLIPPGAGGKGHMTRIVMLRGKSGCLRQIYGLFFQYGGTVFQRQPYAAEFALQRGIPEFTILINCRRKAVPAVEQGNLLQ